MHRSEKHNEGDDQENKGCCDDTAELVKLDQEFQTESFKIQLQNDPVLLGIVSLALKLPLLEKEISPTHYLNYKPPLLVCDFTVSLQTFIC